MDSRRSDHLSLIASIEEAAGRGDWARAEELIAILCQQLPPGSALEAAEYLEHLQRTLLVARTRRAHELASLARLTAAAGFNEIRRSAPPARQEFNESADF